MSFQDGNHADYERHSRMFFASPTFPLNGLKSSRTLTLVRLGTWPPKKGFLAGTTAAGAIGGISAGA